MRAVAHSVFSLIFMVFLGLSGCNVLPEFELEASDNGENPNVIDLTNISGFYMFHDNSQGVLLFDAKTRTGIELLKSNAVDHALISPDGKWLAVYSRNPGRVEVYSVVSGAMEYSHPISPSNYIYSLVWLPNSERLIAYKGYSGANQSAYLIERGMYTDITDVLLGANDELREVLLGKTLGDVYVVHNIREYYTQYDYVLSTGIRRINLNTLNSQTVFYNTEQYLSCFHLTDNEEQLLFYDYSSSVNRGYIQNLAVPYNRRDLDELQQQMCLQSTLLSENRLLYFDDYNVSVYEYNPLTESTTLVVSLPQQYKNMKFQYIR